MFVPSRCLSLFVSSTVRPGTRQSTGTANIRYTSAVLNSTSIRLQAFSAWSWL